MSADDSKEHVALYTILRRRRRDRRRSSATASRRSASSNYLRLPDVCTITHHLSQGPRAIDDRSPFDDRQAARGPARRARGAGHRDPVQGRDRHARADVRRRRRRADSSAPTTARTCCTARARCARSRTRPRATSSRRSSRRPASAPSATSSGEPHEFMQQDNETDWDFIWRLAERIGFEFVVEDQIGVLPQAGAPRARSSSSGPTTLRSFSPRVTAVQQVQEVTSARAGPQDQAGDRGDRARPRSQIAQIGVDRETVAEAFAERHDAHRHRAGQEPGRGAGARAGAARQARQRLHRRRGRVRRQPADQGRRRRSSVRASARSSAAPTGSRHARTSCAAAAPTRRTSPTRPRTRSSARSARTAAARAPSFGGQLVLGIVTNNNDPDSMGRVRVRYPALAADAEGAWARIATPAPATRAAC